MTRHTDFHIKDWIVRPEDRAAFNLSDPETIKAFSIITKRKEINERRKYKKTN